MRNQTIISFFIMFLTVSAGAQCPCEGSGHAISLSFQRTFTGQNVAAIYSFNKKRHNFEFGVKYHLNFDSTRYGNRFLYKDQIRAKNQDERFGVVLGYKYHFHELNENIYLSAFYNLQLSYIHAGYSWLNANNFYSPHIEYWFEGPFFITEHNIGIGITIALWKGLYLEQLIGGGLSSYWYRSEDISKYDGWEEAEDWYLDIEGAFLYRAGFTWRF